MIGNDVIDLKLAKIESNWERKGYLEKVFSTAEQNYIKASINRFQTVWILWSMKESAYKIFNRHTGKRLFNPQHFECKIDTTGNRWRGTVSCREFTCFTQSQITLNMVHTIAVIENSQKIAILEDCDYFKIDGRPFKVNKGKEIPISVSHHGRFKKIVSLIDSQSGF